MAFIPWNHQPNNVVQFTTNYTVPAGYFARVFVTYSMRINSTQAAASATGTTTAGSIHFTPGNKVGTSEFWLSTGDFIEFTVTDTVSGTNYTHQTSSTEATYKSQGYITTVTVRVDPAGGPASAKVAEFDCVSQATSFFATATGAPNLTVFTFETDTEIFGHVELYAMYS
jgi:hypothetical protein